MGVYLLGDQPLFPPASLAEENGLLAVGGALTPPWLLSAYSQGIFPWFSENDPILWWSPDPRLVLDPEKLHVPRSLKKVLRRNRYRITFDRAFAEVIAACASFRGPGREGTWITSEMETAYITLHKAGHAHSVEAWYQEKESGEPQLAGGLYGVAIGACFFGESMFHRRADASKAAFVRLVEFLWEAGFSVIDCQMTTEHLLRFGAREIPRSRFLDLLDRGLARQMPDDLWA